jgi:hypothetical protein
LHQQASAPSTIQVRLFHCKQKIKRKDQDLEARQRRGNPKENPPNTKNQKNQTVGVLRCVDGQAGSQFPKKSHSIFRANSKEPQQKIISKQKSLHAKNSAQQTKRLRPEILWDVARKNF